MKTSYQFILFLFFSVFITASSFAAAPTVPSSNLTYSNILGDRMTLTWTSGNGATRLVIAKQGSPVTFTPVNGVTYNGYQSLGSGEVMITKGSGNTINFTTMGGASNLSLNTTYYFKIIEFNGTGASIQYLTSSTLTGSQTTLAMATEPTLAVASPFVDFKYEEPISGSTRQKMGVEWSLGNGQRTMIIARAGSPVDPAVFPADGTTSYQWKALAGGHFICFYGTGAYMEFKSDGVGKLLPGTTYYFAFITLNGDGVVSNYLTSSYATLAATTLSNAPTTPTTNLTFTNVQTNQMTLNWTSGNGTNRIIIAKQGSPITAVPASGSSYATNASFGSGQYVIYNGAASTFTLAGGTALGALTSGATYYFAIYEYTGSGTTTSYTTTALLGNQATLSYAAEPTAASSVLTFTNVQTTQMTLNWTNGNGANRIIIARTGSAVTATPVDGVDYSINQSFTGSQIVVYKGAANTFTLNGATGLGTLTPNTTYYFSIYEYNGSGTNINYLTSSFLSGNKSTASNATKPTVAASSLVFSNVQTNKMTLSWTNGNGANRLVVMRVGSPVTSTPTDGVSYSNYTSIGSGNIVVYNGSGSTTTVTTDGSSNLTPNTAYYYAIFEYNGSSNSTSYLTSPALTGNQTTASFTAEPTVSSTGLFFTNVHSNKMTLNWTSGNGANRIIIMRAGSPVTSTLVDGTTYPNYTTIGGTSNIVIGAGSGSSMTATTDGSNPLAANTTYYFAIYEYNGSGTNTNYLTSSFLSGNQTTLSSGRIGTDSEGNIAYAAYPNPTTDVLNFVIPSDQDNSRKVVLLNSMGESVYEQDLGASGAEVAINVQHLNKGMYYLTVKSDSKVINQEKVIIY